eukprot:m51a1_g4082 hypothetical protein (362) ;mRNA; f:26686-28014
MHRTPGTPVPRRSSDAAFVVKPVYCPSSPLAPSGQQPPPAHQQAPVADLLVRLSDAAFEALGSTQGTSRETLFEALVMEADRFAAANRPWGPDSFATARQWAASPELFCLMGIRSCMCTEQLASVLAQFCPHTSPGAAERAVERLRAMPSLAKFFEQNRAVRRFHGLALKKVTPQQMPLPLPHLLPLQAPIDALPQPIAGPFVPMELPPSGPPPQSQLLLGSPGPRLPLGPMGSQPAPLPASAAIVGKSVDFVRKTYKKGPTEMTMVGYEIHCEKRLPFIVDSTSLAGLKAMPKFVTGVVESVFSTKSPGDEAMGIRPGTDVHFIRVSFASSPLMPSVAPMALVQEPQYIPSSWLDSTGMM